MENNQSQEVILTRQGLEKIKEELNILKTEKRKEIAERIQVAKDLGDLKENSEYESAKDEQGFLEGRIAQLENMIRTATVIEDGDVVSDKVSVGCTVKVMNLDTKQETSYSIVGVNETDPINRKISTQSPVGGGLSGKAVGDEVEIKLPNGNALKLKVLEISID